MSSLQQTPANAYVSQSISNFPSFEMKSLWLLRVGKKSESHNDQRLQFLIFDFLEKSWPHSNCRIVPLTVAYDFQSGLKFQATQHFVLNLQI